MQRRRFLVGFAGLVGGGSVVTGSAAFTNLSADRTVNVAVAQDDQAYLALDEPDANPNKGFERQSGTKNVLSFDFNGNGPAEGEGVGTDSVYHFDNVFEATNQGTQPVDVFSTYNGTTLSGLAIYDSTDNDRTLLTGGSNTVTLSVGETLKGGIYIDTTDVNTGDYDETLIIEAQA